MNPRYPLYIVSKGRADTRLTSRALEHMQVPYYIVIEDQEYDAYAAVIDPKKIVILDKQYQKDYDTFDDIGEEKSKGPGPARNFVWEHSMSKGHEWHWVMDDNIRRFYRINRNRKHPVGDGTIFRCMEDFCLRYNNVAMAGPNYHMFVPRRHKTKPFIMNTRIYSCNLIRNDTGYRWRGRYNEDTDISLRMLKGGWCTVQFNAFLQQKTVTSGIAGGNTKEFYSKEGTFPKSIMQVKMHPDVSRLVHKFSRIHHHVDYSGFNRPLRLKTDPEVGDEDNDYGMELNTLKVPRKIPSKPKPKPKNG